MHITAEYLRNMTAEIERMKTELNRVENIRDRLAGAPERERRRWKRYRHWESASESIAVLATVGGVWLVLAALCGRFAW